MFAELEKRRQRDLHVQAATLAESSTLKAALDTYLAEARSSDEAGREQLLTTITRELEKVAARVEDVTRSSPSTSGRTRSRPQGRSPDRWPRGRRGAAGARRRSRPRTGIARVGERCVPHRDRPAAGRRRANRLAVPGDQSRCAPGAGARQPVATRGSRSSAAAGSAGDDALAAGAAEYAGVDRASRLARRRSGPGRRVVRVPCASSSSTTLASTRSARSTSR